MKNKDQAETKPVGRKRSAKGDSLVKDCEKWKTKEHLLGLLGKIEILNGT